ncbi:MAG: hypothetical protein LUD81_06015 [Clostridiales bacterium]|nr:hypothetical protein [Clostridiales bacterium]
MPSNGEMINNLIDSYENLQKIKTAKNTEREIEHQLKLIRAKLQAFGIVTDDLDRQGDE